MTQQRVFYACQAVLVIERNNNTGNSTVDSATFLRGVQTVGVSSNVSSTPLFDVGRFQRRTKFNNRQQEFSITIDRILAKDDTTFYKAHTYSAGYTATHILAPENLGVQGSPNPDDKCIKNYDIVLVYGEDDKKRVNDSATLQNVVYRNCLIQNISYNIEVNGSLTESITLISRIVEHDVSGTLTLPSSEQSASVVRRADIDLDTTANRVKLPTEVQQIFRDEVSETINNIRVLGLQSINIELSIDYTELNDVGIWRGANAVGEQNLWRFVSLPLNITCSFVGIVRSIYPYASILQQDEQFVNDKTIRIISRADIQSSHQYYFIWDLGSKNYLNNISVSGGDAGGGNVELTLSYQNDYSDIVIAKDKTIHNIVNDGPY